jgi:hypothetical protein
MPLVSRRWMIVPALLVLAGCAAPNSPDARMDRVDANRDVYETWPITVKEAVLEGRVTRGMDSTMVHVALGRPDEEIKRDDGGIVWVYHKGNSYEVYEQPQQYSPYPPTYGTQPPYSRGGIPVQPQPGMPATPGMRGQIPMQRTEPPPMPTVVRDPRYDVQIVFRDGIVVAGNGIR